MNTSKLAMAFLGLLGLGSAHASSLITFDPDGTGGAAPLTVGAFDWSPDNSLAVGGIPLPGEGEGTKEFVLYTQGRLGNFEDELGHTISTPGLNTDFEITYEAGFSELGETVAQGTWGVISNFYLAPDALNADGTGPGTGVNYFRIYYDDFSSGVQATSQTGAGYNDGKLILEAYIEYNKSNFQINFDNGSPPLTDLDLRNNNDQPGYGTVQGFGGGTLRGVVTYADSDFFITAVEKLFFNTSQITPFQQVEPAGPLTAAPGVAGHVPNFGGAGVGGYDWVNGLGGVCQDGSEDQCDFLFQGDSNMSFEPAPVPEPVGIALLGLGLAALGFRRRRN